MLNKILAFIGDLFANLIHFAAYGQIEYVRASMLVSGGILVFIMLKSVMFKQKRRKWLVRG